MTIRLDKYLADNLDATRKEIKKILKDKLVKVDNDTILDPSFKIDLRINKIYVNDELINDEAFNEEGFIYIMLNKPEGYVSATEDTVAATVLDLINYSKKLNIFPVGRLDIDTTGLLLLTNDGKLAHNLLSPKKHVKKEYYLTYEGKLLDNTKELFSKGIDIGDDTLTKPADINIINNKEAIVTLTEGRFHQVKRMIKACNAEVISLKRIKFRNLVLDESLKEGEYRLLTIEEISDLRKE